MACEDGLRLFRGVFEPLPVTYLFSAWQDINWAAAVSIQVVDDIVNRRCYVAAPLGPGATRPTHLLTVDYTQGLAHDQVDISLDNFTPSVFASICAVKAASTRTELWMGPNQAGPILFLDPTTHNDNGQPVHAVWESGYLRRQTGEEDIDSHFFRVGNASFGVTGNGTLRQTWYGVDRTLSVEPTALALSDTPGRELFSKFDASPLEDVSVRLEVNSVDHHFELTTLCAFCKPMMYNP
jgi:hypothetical protein